MEQQNGHNYNGNRGVLRKLKKIGKVILIIILCIVAAVAIWLVITIYRAVHLANTPPSASTSAPTAADTSTEDPELEYIDVPTYNELHLYADKSSELPISLSDSAYESILESLKSDGSEFGAAEYYALDQALNLYHNTAVNKSTETTLLTNGKLDVDKLIQVVKRNNHEVMPENKNYLNEFYTKLDDSDIALICREICKVVNDTSDKFDINRTANTLENMTLFKRTGTTSNAYVSTELAFIYNPVMTDNYDTIQTIKGGSAEKPWEMVIDHEIMHLIQYGASDNNEENGIETGFSRMYNIPYDEKKIPVDSLYFSWILEAGAELGMADYLGIEPGTYEKKISYVKSYNLSRFYESTVRENALEKVGFIHTLEDAFAALGLKSENEQQEFLKFMYSVEVTQADTEDLWEYYESQTGKTLTDGEKLGIRMDIRTDAVKYMTANFFANLITAIHDGAITDLDTAFYLMRLWELDTFNHLNYTQESSLEHAEDFIVWYNQIQTGILSSVAENNNMDSERIETMYSEYCLQLEENEKDNCNLGNLSAYMQDYILDAKRSYRSSNYSRIYDVAKWLES